MGENACLLLYPLSDSKLQARAGSCRLVQTRAGSFMLLQALTGSCRLLQTRADSCRLWQALAGFCKLLLYRLLQTLAGSYSKLAQRIKNQEVPLFTI